MPPSLGLPLHEASAFHNSLVKIKAAANQSLLAFGGKGYDTQAWLNERPGTRSIGSIYHMTLDDAQVAGLWQLFRQVRAASAGYSSKNKKPGRQIVVEA